MDSFNSGWTAWVGSQAFYEASAFNANIGAWNSAAMTDLSSVCAVSDARSIYPHTHVYTYMYVGI